MIASNNGLKLDDHRTSNYSKNWWGKRTSERLKMNSTRNTVRARSFILFVALLPFTSTFSSAYQIQHTHKDAYAHTHTTALLLIRFECVRRIEYTAVAGTIGVAFVFEWLFILAFVDCRRSRRFSGSLHSLRIDLIVCVVRSQFFFHCISFNRPTHKKKQLR